MTRRATVTVGFRRSAAHAVVYDLLCVVSYVSGVVDVVNTVTVGMVYLSLWWTRIPRLLI
jgi:hypothetical protein